MSAFPSKSRGKAYKVQYFEESTLSWRDIQLRHPGRSAAIAAGEAYYKKHNTRVRLMEIDLDRAQRRPVESTLDMLNPTA